VVEIGLVGVGTWGRHHLRTFASLPDVHLAWVCDTDRRALERVKRESPFVKTTSSYGRNLGSVDAVVIASSARSHHPLAEAALSRGRHVFVEKPLALTLEDGEELVRLAERKKRVLMVGHILLYHPAVQRLRKIVTSGELGTIRYLYSQRVNLGRIRRDENVLWSLGPHDISLSNYLIGRTPVSVRAKGKAYVQKGIEDVVFLDLEYRGDILAHFHLSWLDPHKIRTLALMGSEKMAVFNDMNPEEKIKIYDKGVKESALRKGLELPPSTISVRYGDIHSPRIEPDEPLRIEAEHFVHCIKKGARPRTGGTNGLDVLRVLDAADRSLRSGGSPVGLRRIRS
jgi:predicted dehydrogenase